MDITSLVDSIGSTWMLSITLSKLGSSSYSMLSCVVIIWNYYPPLPPISFEWIHYVSSSTSTTCDPKVILDFFFNGEVIGSGFNLSWDDFLSSTPNSMRWLYIEVHMLSMKKKCKMYL